MRFKEFVRELGTGFFGFAIAVVGGLLLFGEYRNGAEHSHTTHVLVGTAIFGIGCLIIAPSVFGNAAKSLVMIVLDAKKGGMRWTDPPADPPAKPVIPKPPAGAGDV